MYYMNAKLLKHNLLLSNKGWQNKQTILKQIIQVI